MSSLPQPADTNIVALERFAQLKEMIGNTPLLRIRFRFRGEPRVLYAKMEVLNLTGSIKDRMAFHILQSAYRTGRRFVLTLAATYRARQLTQGASPMIEGAKDKPTVTALREIAAGKVGTEILNRGQT